VQSNVIDADRTYCQALLAFLVPFKVARDQVLNDSEVLDLIHDISIFAWAKRLMLNLGEAVFAGQSSV